MMGKVDRSQCSSLPPPSPPGINRRLVKMMTMSKPASPHPYPKPKSGCEWGSLGEKKPRLNPALPCPESSCTGWLKTKIEERHHVHQNISSAVIFCLP